MSGLQYLLHSTRPPVTGLKLRSNHWLGVSVKCSSTRQTVLAASCGFAQPVFAEHSRCIPAHMRNADRRHSFEGMSAGFPGSMLKRRAASAASAAASAASNDMSAEHNEQDSRPSNLYVAVSVLVMHAVTWDCAEFLMTS